MRSALAACLVLVAAAAYGALDFPYARYNMVDESGAIVWGQCPANVAVRRTFVVEGAATAICPEGYEELYHGVLVTAPGARGTRCWADADQRRDPGIPASLATTGACAACWGPVRDKGCLLGQAEGRNALNECGTMLFTQTRRVGFGKTVGQENPGTVQVTGAAVVIPGMTECPTREPIDAAQATIPAGYRTAPYTKLYAGKIYHGAGNVLAQQCWETPPQAPAGTFTAVGDCVVCQ